MANSRYFCPVFVCIILASFVVFGESHRPAFDEHGLDDSCLIVERYMPIKNKFASCLMCVIMDEDNEDVKKHCVFNQIPTPPYLTCQRNITPAAEGSSFSRTDCEQRYEEDQLNLINKIDVLWRAILTGVDGFKTIWKFVSTTENDFHKDKEVKKESPPPPVSMDKTFLEPSNDQKFKSVNDKIHEIELKLTAISDEVNLKHKLISDKLNEMERQMNISA